MIALPDELKSLPQKLGEMSALQRDFYVSFLAGLGITELRQRQSLNAQQINMLYSTEAKRGYLLNHEIIASDNLNIIEDLLMEAVGIASGLQ